MPGVTFIADDHNTTPEITKAIANHARYLAIPSPYTWEVFQCSMGMHYQNQYLRQLGRMNGRFSHMNAAQSGNFLEKLSN